ncbi:MAG TPA: hypothetical protein QGF95_23190 [Candidatus Latescibacteria bacterium]|jgi:hypothetical protein|nr:hypothetical protein [Gemmatimonadaceae bacterium]MDP6015046.1 hypothetical protein [Candidatus Latescibacterota bacterium]HJP33465.1 hypothetical protein [Candidatus Latescibacterota bacterium]
MTTSTNASEHLQALGAPSFKLWIYLCRKAQAEGVEEFSVVVSEVAKESGIAYAEGRAGLGPVRAALRRLVSAQYVTAVPEKERRLHICLLKMVDIR